MTDKQNIIHIRTDISSQEANNRTMIDANVQPTADDLRELAEKWGGGFGRNLRFMAILIDCGYIIKNAVYMNNLNLKHDREKCKLAGSPTDTKYKNVGVSLAYDILLVYKNVGPAGLRSVKGSAEKIKAGLPVLTDEVIFGIAEYKTNEMRQIREHLLKLALDLAQREPEASANIKELYDELVVFTKIHYVIQLPIGLNDE